MPARNRAQAIPAPVGIKDPAVSRILSALREHALTADQHITQISDTQRVIRRETGAQQTGELIRPNPPVNLTAQGIFGAIILEVEALPPSAAKLEWLAAPANDLAQARVIGQSAIPLFKHYVGDNQTRWYWVRSVGYGNPGLKSAVSQIDGVKATSAKNIDLILANLQDQIGRDELTQDVTSTIDKISGTGPGSINSVYNQIFDDPTAEVLTFDVANPGTTAQPIGWRGGNDITGYVDSLDGSQAAYGALAEDAGEWFLAKCFRMTQAFASFTGQVQVAVVAGYAQVMVRFYDDGGLRISESQGDTTAIDTTLNYSFSVPNGAQYIELVLVAADSPAYADTIPLWFDQTGA